MSRAVAPLPRDARPSRAGGGEQPVNIPGRATRQAGVVRATPSRAAARPALDVETARRIERLAVLRNRPFLLLWLAQLSTQVGGNMVIYGLTIIITASDRLDHAPSAPSC